MKMSINGTKIYSYGDLIDILKDEQETQEALDIISMFPEYVKNNIIQKIGDEKASVIRRLQVIDECERENPYKELDFQSDRIEVNELIAYIDDEDTCKTDGSAYKKIQVVICHHKGKRYGMMLRCCEKCKKVLIESSQEYETMERLEKSEINYILIGEEIHEKRFS